MWFFFNFCGLLYCVDIVLPFHKYSTTTEPVHWTNLESHWVFFYHFIGTYTLLLLLLQYFSSSVSNLTPTTTLSCTPPVSFRHFLNISLLSAQPSTITHPPFIFRRRRRAFVDLLESGGGGGPIGPPLLDHLLFLSSFLPHNIALWQPSRKISTYSLFFPLLYKNPLLAPQPPWATPLKRVYTLYCCI